MAKRTSKVPGSDATIEIDEPGTEEEVTVTGHDLKAEMTKPEVKVEPPKPEVRTTVDDPSLSAAMNDPEGIPPPGAAGSPFGDTSQRYEGEADPAQIIKARNVQRVYEQHGLPMPAPGEPTTPEIESIDPTEAEIGGSDFELTVTGKYFSPGSMIVFNGGIEPTTLSSETEASTVVKPSLASIAITVPVLIRSAAGMDSNAVDFSFVEPVVRSGKKSKAKSVEDDDE